MVRTSKVLAIAVALGATLAMAQPPLDGGAPADLELRERAFDDVRQTAEAVNGLSKTPRGRALAEQLTVRLTEQAPLVLADLRLLSSIPGGPAPTVRWHGAMACVFTGRGPLRCYDEATSAWTGPPSVRELAPSKSLAAGVTLKGRLVTLQHTPPDGLGPGGDWDSSTQLLDGAERWAPWQLMLSGVRPEQAPSELLLSPDLSRGVAVVPIYGNPKCTRSAGGTILSLGRGCQATFQIVEQQLWLFSTAPK